MARKPTWVNVPEAAERGTRRPCLLGFRMSRRLHSLHLLVDYLWQQMTSPTHRFHKLRVNNSASDEPFMAARSPQYSIQVTLAPWLQSEAIKTPRYALRAFVRGFECYVSPLHPKNTPKRALSTLSRQRGVSRWDRL